MPGSGGDYIITQALSGLTSALHVRSFDFAAFLHLRLRLVHDAAPFYLRASAPRCSRRACLNGNAGLLQLPEALVPKTTDPPGQHLVKPDDRDEDPVQRPGTHSDVLSATCQPYGDAVGVPNHAPRQLNLFLRQRGVGRFETDLGLVLQAAGDPSTVLGCVFDPDFGCHHGARSAVHLDSGYRVVGCAGDGSGPVCGSGYGNDGVRCGGMVVGPVRWEWGVVAGESELYLCFC